MLRQATNALLYLLVGTAAGSIVLGGFALWRLSAGPVAAPFLVPVLESALGAGDASYRVEIGDATLRWGGWTHPIDILLRNLRAVDNGERTIAAVPEAAVGLSVPALLTGTIAPTRLELVQPQVRFSRDKSGEWHFGLLPPESTTATPPQAPAPETSATAPAAADARAPQSVPEFDLLALLNGPEGFAARARHLRRVGISGGSVAIEDAMLRRSYRAPRFDIHVLRVRHGLSADFALDVDSDGERTSISGQGAIDPTGGRFDGAFDFDNLHPDMAAEFVPMLGAIKVLTTPLAGRVETRIGFDGKIEHLAFDVNGGKGHLAPIAPFAQGADISAVTLRGAFDPLARAVELIEGKIDFGGPILSIGGRWQLAADKIAVAGAAELQNLPVADLKRLWPESVAVGGRRWIVGHILAGQIESLGAKFEASAPAGDMEALSLTALTGTVRYSGLTIAYLPPMAPAERVSGTAEFDADMVAFRIQGGSAGKVSITDGMVTLSGLSGIDNHLGAVDIGLKGAVPDLLGVLNAPPLQAAKWMSVAPEKTAGDFTGRIALKLPLLGAVTFDQMTLAAGLETKGAKLPGVALGKDVTDAALSIKADTKSVNFSGTLAIDGTPAKLRGTEDYGKSRKFRRRYQVIAAPDEAALKRLGFDVGAYVKGPAAIDVTWTEIDADQGEVALLANLTGAALSIPSLNWTRAAGPPAVAKAQFALKRGGATTVRQFSLSGEGINATGSAVFAPGGRLERLQIPRAVLGDNDFALALARKGGGWQGKITGARIDVRDFLKPSDEEKDPPLDLALQLEAVRTGDDGGMTALSGTLLRDDNDWQSVNLQGRAGENGQFQLTLTPTGGAGNERALSLNAADAGALFRAVGYLRNINGGKLGLRGKLVAGSGLSGNVEIAEFRVRKAPVLAQILRLASLYGIVDLLGGDGVRFSRLVGEIKMRSGQLTLKDIRAVGPDLGISLNAAVDTKRNRIDGEGAIAPAYAINSIIGLIPLVGDVLTGGEGGVFAASYSLSGALDDPTTSVNPLTALAPGILRNIFGIFDNGGKSNGKSNGGTPP